MAQTEIKPGPEPGQRSQSRAGVFEYVFPAIRGVQAGREYYVTMCPLRLIPRLFVFDEEELPPEMRAQRSLNKARVPEMARYMVDNPQSYVFSALTASINAAVQFEPFDGEGAPAERVGTLIVPMSAKFVINDGQHRRAAIQQALIDSPELGDESIAIVLFLDIGLERCQQMFADLNRYAIRPSRSIGVLYDHRDEMSAITKLLVMRSALFSDLTDMETSNLAARSRKLFTLSALYHATKALLDGVEVTSFERRVDVAGKFWELAAEQFPEWHQVHKREVSAGEIRRDFIHSHGIVLHALGKIGNSMALASTDPANWEPALHKLQEIDWRRANTAMWEGRALLGGKVSKTAANVLLTTAAIRTVLGLQLPPEEQHAENAFTKGREVTRSLPIRARSAFDDSGFADTLDALVAQTQALYLADEVPWVVGYSGGKDSTAVLQLTWMALAGLPTGRRPKHVHVISTDTLVENPVVAAWVTHSLEVLADAAEQQGLPITPHRLTPSVTDTFWVNLIGRGYPAPRPKFRWCTERLKIKPSNAFIREMVRSHGEAILVLGTRKAESSGRSHRMTALEARRVRDLLSPNDSLPNCLVYSPIDSWSNDDVWTFLMQRPNPWGYSNKELLTMYQGASPDGECPLVVDATTPSCGDSRFGCWTCTLVDKDKSMSAMIQNDEEKEWMLPLLDLRDALDVADDRHLRDFRRMNGSVQLFHERPIPGPYTQEARERWLTRLLEAQTWIRANGPEYVRSLELITLPELEEIRRIWVVDKHEFDDRVPVIFQAATGEQYPGAPLDEHLPLGPDTAGILRSVIRDDRLHFELVRELLDIEQRHRAQARRAGLFESLEKTLRRGFYDDEADATARALRRREALQRDTPAQPDTEPDPLDLKDGYVRLSATDMAGA